jgi:hypothetical protein
MKLAIVYNFLDNKLRPETYSWIYKGMFDAIVKRFDIVCLINYDRPASEIDADVILFFDVNSNHEINISGIENHPALKLEYMSDPHQQEVYGVYSTTQTKVHKLGIKQRLDRALYRGIDYIICPVRDGYMRYFEPFLKDRAEKMLWYFPLAPDFPSCGIPLVNRFQKILGNGATWDGGIGCYEFRKWAFKQNTISVVNHFLLEKETPMGIDYHHLLEQYAGALALSEFYPVNKYFEMPMAGCLTFVQYHKEYEELGFKDYKHCIYVNKGNFECRTKGFLLNMGEYQGIANAGRKLMEENYTAKHFADFIYSKVLELKR